jgi:UDP-N-acetylglucosamine 1-carboxyvinyltransferase
MAACLLAEGTTVFIETIFEDRFRHVPDLRRMGAEIQTDGKTAVIRGVRALHGASVTAADLRGGAALVAAALAAEGESTIRGLKHLDRGYEELETTLGSLGAEIRRSPGGDEGERTDG